MSRALGSWAKQTTFWYLSCNSPFKLHPKHRRSQPSVCPSLCSRRHSFQGSQLSFFPFHLLHDGDLLPFETRRKGPTTHPYTCAQTCMHATRSRRSQRVDDPRKGLHCKAANTNNKVLVLVPVFKTICWAVCRMPEIIVTYSKDGRLISVCETCIEPKNL